MFPIHYPYYRDQRQTKKLLKDLEKAIDGEFSAIQRYANIAQLARTDKERKQILEIRKDEQKHYKQFVHLYTQLTGKQPQPKITEECPNSYRKGIEFALRDEQNTVDFYLDIADESNHPYIKEVFRRAAADEQNHAVWFLYFLVNLNWLRS
ncbi:ferritin-like domain-containing protein [Niallia oryzisoli]|uniref:Ferritin-like domain-containing protein n=1 Tax=Niallia oryzisoli TaxID=1737571 RepID=A0ABZ2CAG8_9BACI